MPTTKAGADIKKRSRFQSNNKGATLIEILISAAIILILATAAAMAVMNCRYFASYSRHKTQAMFAAQQIIEQTRRSSFSPVSSVTSASVELDTYGSTVAPSGYFYGTATITVTNIDIYRNKVSVQITWPEQMLNGKINMNEFYSTVIVNDPIPN